MRIATSSVMLFVVVTATLSLPADAQQAPKAEAQAATAPAAVPSAASAPSSDSQAVEAAPVAIKISAEMVDALELWRKAAKSTPKLVSLMKDAQAKEPQTPTQQIKARLQVLGDKTFSNREWRHYWHQQAQRTGKLAEVAKAANKPKMWIDDLKAWQALATNKIQNQDAYLTAIERERDALEERLESLLEREEKKPDLKSEPMIDEPSPFQVRQRTLRDLRRRAEQQSTKKQQSTSALKLIEGQLEVEKILLKALDNDVTLAIREQTIATKATTTSQLPWVDVWNDIKTRSAGKVDALKREARFEA
ncbi:MAG TPA: hypothetical protein DCQ06_07075, partial [Myxococcales bacterium]|nr:hypothetical protein [Myxococcales bacterium]